MKKYIGTFSTKDNSLVQVRIEPSKAGVYDTVEIYFPFEEPVTITLESNGLFTPIKTKSCTIRIFTDEIFWDLYTKSSTDYAVTVTCGSDTIFKGFITPCIYTLDYTYNGIVELECVDCLAVLDTIKYDSITNGEYGVYKVDDIIKNICSKVPTLATGYRTSTNIDIKNYYLQESNFFDDDGEPMTCKEVIENICLYFGIYCTMVNSVVNFIAPDYNRQTTETLNTDNYKAGTPTVALDECYKQIDINCNLYEMKDLVDEIKVGDNLFYKYNNELYSRYHFKFRYFNQHTEDENIYTLYSKPYDLETNSKWEILPTGQDKTNDVSLLSYIDDSWFSSDSFTGENVMSPYYYSAYPIRYKITNRKDGITDDKFTDAVMIKNYVNDEEEPLKVLKYTGDEILPLSIEDGKSYIILNHEVFFETDTSMIEGGEDPSMPFVNFAGKIKSTNLNTTGLIPVPLDMDRLKINKDGKDIRRLPNYHPNPYTWGVPLIQAELKVGDKYWDGTQWTTTPSTFNFFYWDSEPETGADLVLSSFKWLKPLSNKHLEKYEVEKEGYAVPVTEADQLCGRIEFSIYNLAWNNPHIAYNNKIPLMFIKNIEVKYAFRDNRNWAEDKDNDLEDIIYSSVDSEGAYDGLDFDGLELKINSWYQYKPMSKSYILDSNKLPVLKINNYVQEQRLLDMYYNHYKEPKKILSLNYNLVMPSMTTKYYHPSTNSYYLVDSYDLDLVNMNNRIKFVEL